MNQNHFIKKLTVLLLTTVCISQTMDETSQGKFISFAPSNFISEESTLLVSGESYYPYQWALKNNGTLRQISISGGEREAGSSAYGPGSGIPGGGENGGWQPAEEQVISGVAGIDIGIEAAWEQYEQSTARRMVTVALIDTGVDITHTDLKNAIWINSDEIPGDGIDNDNNGYADDVNGWNFYSGNNQVFVGQEDSHGTHGAGTIAGAWDGQGMTGIADSSYVKIIPLKVLASEEGMGISDGVKQAIRYAQANGADICNLSMGTLTYDEELETLIRNSPMLFVASAGNGDEQERGFDIDTLPVYPAAYSSDNIITVANLRFDGSLSASSNYGAVSVDIAAPGTYILSTVPGGYGFMSGTSMAAPMVTGTAALLYSCRPELTLADVKRVIMSSAKQMDGLRGKTVSGGMLDAYGAIVSP